MLSEILDAILVNITDLWYVKPCRLVGTTLQGFKFQKTDHIHNFLSTIFPYFIHLKCYVFLPR